MCRRRRFPPSHKRIQRVCDRLEKADGTVVGNREQLHGLQKLQNEHFEYAIDFEAPRGRADLDVLCLVGECRVAPA